MTEKNQITLTVAGDTLRGWASVKVRTSVQELCPRFEFVASPTWPGTKLPYPGQPCTVRAGDDLLVTGYLDVVDLGDNRVTVTGRPKTADVVDNSVSIGTVRKKTLLGLAKHLCSPHGIDVTSDVTTKQIKRFVPQRGETIFAALDRAASAQAVLLVTDPQGRLVITRRGSARATTNIECPGNVLKGWRVKYDASKRYDTYECRGQMAGTPDVNGDALSTRAISNDGVFTDMGATRNRYLYITGKVRGGKEGRADRATWEAVTRAGQSTQASYPVAGLRQRDGRLWRVNEIVRVNHEQARLVDEDLLIVSADYSVDKHGSVCTLGLMPPEAFDLLEPVRTKGKFRRGVWRELDNVVVPEPLASEGAVL